MRKSSTASGLKYELKTEDEEAASSLDKHKPLSKSNSSNGVGVGVGGGGRWEQKLHDAVIRRDLQAIKDILNGNEDAREGAKINLLTAEIHCYVV